MLNFQKFKSKVLRFARCMHGTKSIISPLDSCLLDYPTILGEAHKLNYPENQFHLELQLQKDNKVESKLL
jgi:hypothetical protein